MSRVGLSRKDWEYASEAEFLRLQMPNLKRLIKKTWGDPKLQKEVTVGRDVADLVAFVNNDAAQRHTAIRLSAADCVVLSVLRRDGPTRIDLLEAKCGVHRGSLRNGSMRKLEDAQLIARGRGGRIAGTVNAELPTVIAFEAKLRRWRDALEQAVTYRRYADFAYVLIPDRGARSALKARAEFESRGVGLIVAYCDGLRREIEAIAATEHDWRREFVLHRHS